jgi:hypothetical protein
MGSFALLALSFLAIFVDVYFGFTSLADLRLMVLRVSGS